MFAQDAFRSAREDFRRARQRAALQEIVARLSGRSAELLSYEEISRALKITGQAERGLREIPLEAIVGSVGRYTDFTRDFLPKQDSDEQRWASVKAATTSATGPGMPPIEVYQIGGAYFVRDGNHRVSIARELGFTHLPAYVTEVRTRVPLTPTTSPDELILKAEYADFLERTQLDRSRSAVDLTVTAPGRHAELLEHIAVHRQVMRNDLEREVPYDEAAADWYDHAYLPVVRAFRDRGLLRHFPGRTETDLYVWVAKHRPELEAVLGWQIKPEMAAADLAHQIKTQNGNPLTQMGQRIIEAVIDPGPPPGEWRQERLTARYLERLFSEILVPISGEPESWQALEQALELARHDHSQLNGLHVALTDAHKAGESAQRWQARFDQRCAEAGVTGKLALEVGEVTPRICERAALADLVVIHLAYPPNGQNIGFKNLLRRCPRPVLAVPGAPSPMRRALLAYDGNAKAKEALFVATYLAEMWKTELVIATVPEKDRDLSLVLDYARRYLDLHELQADFIAPTAPTVAEAMLSAAQSLACDVIVMGGYSTRPVLDVVVGSAVDQILRQTTLPVLICR